MDKYTILLDFDGTVVEHDYPRIGRCNFGSIEVIYKLQQAGHDIILNTYRADLNDGSLEKALELLNGKAWMLTNPRNTEIELDIKIYNKIKLPPAKWDWSVMERDKIMYIDDIALNIPLKRAVMVKGFIVDWTELDNQFKLRKLYE